ncbi:hypothetical protein O7627_17560 [Solwaraspora sp. WMMD1047]|uniref:hypothetical protein n=1 Tax=Solwaraspora sp. WMMD1047 TaxID=3016102 RepID=UPI002416552E|nr:hypothetical protein [Solwaraspora sp. WMMD1047]MDG4831104.1 hypothetical protein [Solwaraspora sp. WMMD1047]
MSAAAALLGAVVAQSPAHAVMETRPADGSQHDYCLHSTFTTDPATAHTAMISALDGPTDMTALFRHTCPTGPRGNSTIDVWFMEGGLVNPDARGEYRCQVPVGSVCDTANVRINFPQIVEDGGPQPENREKTVVHEVGHSVGLGEHTHTPCAMRQGTITSTALAHRRFASSDITLINNHY